MLLLLLLLKQSLLLRSLTPPFDLQPGPMQASNNGMGGFMGGGARPMLPSDYKLAPPPTNAYQTDLALAAAANSMTPMPMVSFSPSFSLSFSLSLVTSKTEGVGSPSDQPSAQLIYVYLVC